MNANLGISIAYSFLIYDMIRMRARVRVPARACVRVLKIIEILFTNC